MNNEIKRLKKACSLLDETLRKEWGIMYMYNNARRTLKKTIKTEAYME